MDKRKLIPLLLAAAMTLPLAAGAEDGMPRPGAGHRGEHRGPPFLRGVDLSDGQEDKLFQLMHDQEPYLREQQRAHEKAMRALHEMGRADKFDDAAAAKLAQTAAQAQANLTLSRIRTHQKVLALLTPEQRKQLEERKDRLHRGGSNER